MTGNDLLTHGGITQPVNEWALDYGIYPSVIVDRLTRGWPVGHAITKPMAAVPHQRLDANYMPPGMSGRPATRPRPHRRNSREGVRYEHDGRHLTVAEWSAATGIRIATINYRLRHGWTVGMTLTTAPRRPGVVADFAEPVGTGGGPVAQDFSEIEFSS